MVRNLRFDWVNVKSKSIMVSIYFVTIWSSAESQDVVDSIGVCV